MTSLVNYEDESRHLGDNYFAPLTNLETAIEQIKKACRDNNSLIDILNELAEFIQSDTSREIIGLEEKLNRGSRQDLFRRATELKNRFAMRVAKNQMLLPNFFIMDNIEDKGMVDERSHNFQQIIVDECEKLTEPYQLIFTTSMINPALEGSTLCVGPMYEKGSHTLEFTKAT